MVNFTILLVRDLVKMKVIKIFSISPCPILKHILLLFSGGKYGGNRDPGGRYRGEIMQPASYCGWLGENECVLSKDVYGWF